MRYSVLCRKIFILIVCASLLLNNSSAVFCLTTPGFNSCGYSPFSGRVPPDRRSDIALYSFRFPRWIQNSLNTDLMHSLGRDAYPFEYIIIECETKEQVREAVECEVDRILLDNMNPAQVKQAIMKIRDSAVYKRYGKPLTEVS